MCPLNYMHRRGQRCTHRVGRHQLLYVKAAAAASPVKGADQMHQGNNLSECSELPAANAYQSRKLAGMMAPLNRSSSDTPVMAATSAMSSQFRGVSTCVSMNRYKYSTN